MQKQSTQSQQNTLAFRNQPRPSASLTTNASNISLFQKGYLAATLGQSQDSNPFWNRRHMPKIPSWRFYNWWNKGYLQAIEDKQSK